MKGRKKDSSTLTIITDPFLEPFFISKDQNSFTLMKKTNPAEEINHEKFNKSEISAKVIGHYSDFSNVLKAVAKQKMNTATIYSSIKDYLNDYNDLIQKLNITLNNIQTI
jgi:hypothetical protein